MVLSPHLPVTGIAQSLQRLATGWTVRASNPGGGEIFRTRPDLPWGPPSFIYNGYRYFPGDKATGRGVNHPPPSVAEVKERVELYLYSPSGTWWPVLGSYPRICLEGQRKYTKEWSQDIGVSEIRTRHLPSTSSVSV